MLFLLESFLGHRIIISKIMDIFKAFDTEFPDTFPYSILKINVQE